VANRALARVLALRSYHLVFAATRALRAVADLVSRWAMRALRPLALIVALVSVATGDTPLPPLSKVTVNSPSGRIRAISDPKAGTCVEDTTLHKVLWSLPDWHRSLFVSDDGKHLVTQYDGLNLIPTDFTDDLVLLTFWREGRKRRDVKVRDFVPDRHILKHTASHYHWGRVHGIDAQGHLKVERADGKIFFFDLTTGNKINR
jgi:hypothetical protein